MQRRSNERKRQLPDRPANRPGAVGAFSARLRVALNARARHDLCITDPDLALENDEIERRGVARDRG